MVHMAHHLPNTNPHGQHSQSSFMAVRRSVNFPEVARREYPGQMSPEEIITYNRELAKAREHPEAPEWITRQKNFDIRHDAKRNLMTPNEEVRKHLEKDAYFRANQEYLRLMNDEPSRQTFREKQRLTEDLEKQKRLLIEDLARDQQLKQDKYKRNHGPTQPPFPSPADIRNLHFANEKGGGGVGGEIPLSLRLKPESHMYPFPPPPQGTIDPRFPPQHLTNSDEFHNYRRIQENMMKMGKHTLDAQRQCSHSDFRRIPQELGSIIQEKEKRIKEMEEKIVKLEHEARSEALLPPHQHPSAAAYHYATSASPPSKSPLQTRSPTSSLSPSKPRQNSPPLHSVSSVCNENGQPIERQVQSYPMQELSATDNNNNNTDNDTKIKIEQRQSPKKERINSPTDYSNSSNEDLVIDEKQEAMKSDKNIDPTKCVTEKSMTRKATHSPLSRQDSNLIKLEPSSADDSVKTEVVEDDISFNELKYGVKVHVQPAIIESNQLPSSETPIIANTIPNKLESDEIDNKNGVESNEQDVESNIIRVQKRKKGLKMLARRDENSSPPDFQASQNRLSLDLPGHNWLEKRLKQQNVLASNVDGVLQKPKDEIVISEYEDEVKVTESMVIEDKKEETTIHLTQENNNEEKNDLEVTPSSNENKIPLSAMGSSMTNTLPFMPAPNITSEMRDKEPPRSELLLKMLDPSTNTQLTSRITSTPVINLSNTVSTTSEIAAVARRNEELSRLASQHRISIETSNANQMPTIGNASNIIVPPPRSSDEFLRNAPNIDAKASRIGPNAPGYQQEVRPNLVLERRRDPETVSQQVPFILPKSHQNPTASKNMPYSKFIVEERYNRKRPIDEQTREEKERAEFSERFFNDLERGMSAKGKTEMTVLGEKDNRMHPHSVEPLPTILHRRSLEEVSANAKMEGLDYDYLSRFRESHSQPPLSYKTSDMLLKSPTAGAASKSASEFTLAQHMKRQVSPQPPHTGSFRSFEERISIEKAMHRRGSSAECLPPVLNGRMEVHLRGHHPPDGVDPLLLSKIENRKRELKIIEEARRREEIHRSALEAVNRKERLLSQSVSVNKLQRTLPSPEEHLMNLNEKVRTVEDLRALQLGMPPPTNGFQRYMRPQTLRNDRLTEREKHALREADLIQASLRQETMSVSRQDIHNAYLKHARRKSSLGSNFTSPNSKAGMPPSSPRAFSEEQFKMASLWRQQQQQQQQHEEEEASFRAAHHERVPLPDQREGYHIPKEVIRCTFFL